MSGNRNFASIDAIIARTKSVNVNGFPITLTLPDADQIRGFRAEVAAATAQVKDGEEIATEAALLAFQELTVAAVALCAGADRDTALRLVVASGGETSDLCLAAQDMMGLKRVDADAGDQAEIPF